MKYLNTPNKNPAKVRNFDEEFAKQFNFIGLTFLVHKKGYAKIEKQNNFPINIPYLYFKTNFWKAS